MDLFYTGVGSRKTPPEIMALQTKIAIQLARWGYIGRSGSANGSDLAFEEGGISEQSFRSYLPWVGFNGFSVDRFHVDPSTFDNYEEATSIARSVHPLGDSLKGTSLKFHARNVYQVLGDDLQTPSRVLICWSPPTKDGVEGGTNTAVQIAKLYNIPWYNLFFPWHREEVTKRLRLEDL